MLIARGQLYQGRRIADLLLYAVEAGLPVEPQERQQIYDLTNAIADVQGGRQYLGLMLLEALGESSWLFARWAALLWRARVLGGAGDIASARQLADRSVSCGEALAEDAACWARCVAAELLAQAGDGAAAERLCYQVLSAFVEEGEVRGQSQVYLSLAQIYRLGGEHEQSLAAAETAYRTDGSWTGPALWLARRSIEAGEAPRALSLLESIPNPSRDAYQLIRMLKLIVDRQIPLAAVRRTLALTDQPASAGTIASFEQLLNDYPGFWPARESLAWKLLLVGRVDEAQAQHRKMGQESADRQSLAAVSFGLQEHRRRSPEPGRGAPKAGASAANGQPERLSGSVNEPSRPAEAATEARPARAPVNSGFVGQLSLFAVPELIQFLSSSRKTGIVSFSRGQGEARIRLYEGSLCWAESPAHPRLGAYLAAKRALTEQQAIAVDGGCDIGTMVREPDVGMDRVREALGELLHVTLKELVLEWTDGMFLFDRSSAAVALHDAVLFNSQGLLLDVMREIDEEQR